MTEQTDTPRKISKSVIKTAAHYIERMRSGERIMRDANDRLQWASGKPVGRRTVEYLLEQGEARELDTDLFGDPRRGQTIGLVS